ncbi:MAG: DedA family protein [Candidatus Baltobacteraceae bacterium]
MEHIYQVFLQIVDHAGYPGLFLVMTLGALGVPVGTEVVMPTAGALAATGHGHLSSVWLAGIVGTLGEVLGAAILYTIGYYGGRPFVARWGRYVGLSLHKLDIAHAFYERYGKKTVFICRFIPIIRGVSSLPAGISQMQKRYFFTYTTLGSAIFCIGLAALGGQVGNHVDAIQPYIHAIAYGILGLVIVAAIAYVAYVRSASKRGSRAA